MKNDLEILIDHLQAEVDYLKREMDACIKEWDFDGAKSFREPFILTRRKLIAAKCLENPNFDKISKLKGSIQRLESRYNTIELDFQYLGKKPSSFIKEHHKKSIQNQISIKKINLEKLESQVIESKINNDLILELFERLDLEEIDQIEFEVKKDKINLIIKIEKENLVLKFVSNDHSRVHHYIHESYNPLLRKLGFNTETYKKYILDYKEINKTNLLTELSIIYFELFGIFGQKIELKIETKGK